MCRNSDALAFGLASGVFATSCLLAVLARLQTLVQGRCALDRDPGTACSASAIACLVRLTPLTMAVDSRPASVDGMTGYSTRIAGSLMHYHVPAAATYPRLVKFLHMHESVNSTTNKAPTIL